MIERLRAFTRRQAELFSRSEQLNYILRTSSEYYDADAAESLEKEINRHNNSTEAAFLLKYYDTRQQSEEERAMLNVVRSNYDDIPPELSAQLKTAFIAANREFESGCDEARYADALDTVFTLCRRVAALQNRAHPMDGFLDRNQRGLTTAKLDGLMKAVKEACLNIVQNAPRSEEPRVELPAEKTKLLCEELSMEMGLDYKAGDIGDARLAFCNICGNRDVKVAVCKSDFKTWYFGMMHELGHARYIFDTRPELEDNGLWLPASSAMDEAVALFFDTMVGRSRPYLSYLNGRLSVLGAHGRLDHRKRVRVTPTRLGCDTATYLLHIIIRYEVEKLLLEGAISVAELGNEWDRRTLEYLGVVGENYRETYGADVHWTIGYIGYFPMYLLGRIYAHWIWANMPDQTEELENGRLGGALSYLRENITQFGRLYTVDEIFERMGTEPETDRFMKYLEQSYFGD